MDILASPQEIVAGAHHRHDGSVWSHPRARANVNRAVYLHDLLSGSNASFGNFRVLS